MSHETTTIKTQTLPRIQRDTSPTPSSNSFASLKTATSEKIRKMSLIKKRKKKKKDSNSLDIADGNMSPSESKTDVSDVDSQEISPSGGQSPSNSPSLLRSQEIDDSDISNSPRSPRKTKNTIRSFIKGSRNLMFKGKHESIPVTVESVLDLQRSNKKELEDLSTIPSNEDILIDGEECMESGIPRSVEEKDSYDWSMKNTCARVKKLSISDRRESAYEDELENKESTANMTTSLPSTPEVFEESETGKNAFHLSSSPPQSPEVLSDHSRNLSPSKKSTAALKEEILQFTRQKSLSEKSANGNVIRNRKISLQARNSSDKKELLFKILVIGELGTGKTSIIKRYVHQFFSQHYRATIGVDFALKVLQWDNDTTIRLQLWDIAGQERFGNMTRVYYKEAVGAFIVFDVTRTGTFDAVVKWKQDLDSKVLADGEAIPCVLLANKCDEPKEGIVNNPSKMDEFCRENQFVAWFETSAKDNINIDEAANCLINKIIENDRKRQQEKETTTAKSSGNIVIDEAHDAPSKKSCSC